jgi:hypothetical protein
MLASDSLQSLIKIYQMTAIQRLTGDFLKDTLRFKAILNYENGDKSSAILKYSLVDDDIRHLTA